MSKQSNPNQCTGPVTPEGKFQSSRNAISHGLTAANIDRLPESIRDSFRSFLDEQYAEWLPVTSNECLYLERYAFAQFQLTRANMLLTSAIEACLADPADAEANKRHTQIQRHSRALERSAKEAICELRLMISDRLAAASVQAAFTASNDSLLPIATMYPSHRLVHAKECKLSTQENGLRFVKEQYYRFVTQTNSFAENEESREIVA